MSGDNGSGSGGSWTVKDNVVVCTDRIGSPSQDKQMLEDICSVIRSSGKNATVGERNPSSPYHMNSSHSDSTIFSIVGGVCWGTAIDYKHTLSKQLSPKNNNIVWGYLTGSPGRCTLKNITSLKSYAHDWYYGDIAKGEERNQASSEIIETYGGWVAAPDANSLANAFLSGKGGSSGGTTGATATEGFTHAGRGESPQYWTIENYTEPEEITFSNFEIIDENPRVMTASFESTEKIEMMSGRVAVLITGNLNQFGGIIIKRDYDSKSKVYKYQCQGFLDRILANPIYAVHNGSKTVHRLLQETLNDCGLPDVNLMEEDDYDVYIDEETRYLMSLDEDLSETSDIFTGKEDFTVDKESGGVTVESDDGSDEEKKEIKTVTQTLSSNKENTIRNPFKKKPTGIYDCDTYGDYIRTLIFDYGLNVDFYGDINGIPHFDILSLETWKQGVWGITADMGYDTNITSSFDITNIITQVGIKNIQASNGQGELYTSEDLFGVNFENYVGRMGVIEDNPSANITYTEGEEEEEKVNQLNEVFQDSTGKSYEGSEVIVTNGEPSCNKCPNKNGGLKPTMQKYKKSWVNLCPGCNEKKVLEDKSTSSDYKTVCKNCGKTYCQYCGCERNYGEYKLTEVFVGFENSANKKTETSEGGN